MHLKKTLPIIILTITGFIAFNASANAQVSVELTSPKSTIEVGEETTVTLKVAQGTEQSTNAFSFLIKAPDPINISNLTNKSGEQFYVDHLNLSRDNTNNIKVETLSAKEPNQSWVMQQGSEIISFNVSSTVAGVYTLYLDSNFSNSVLNIAGEDILQQTYPTELTIEIVEPQPNEPITDLLTDTSNVYTLNQGTILGEAIYIDRPYKANQVPTEIQSIPYYIKTANNDKRHSAESLISFNLNQNAEVYVAHDSRYQIKPTWLQSWNKTSYQIVAPGAGTFDLYKRIFISGQVILGQNFNPEEIEDNSMYFVMVNPIQDLPTNEAPSVDAGNYNQVEVNETMNLNINTNDDGIPSPLTYNWQTLSGTGLAYFSDINEKNPTVYFDTPGTYVLEVTVNDGQYQTSDTATIQVVQAVELLVDNITSLSGKTYELGENFDMGSKQYIDRNYTLASVPVTVKGAKYIRTANNDKQDIQNNFLTFHTNVPSTVYVAHDNRLSQKPTWLLGFTQTTDTIYAPGAGNFTLYKKDFTAGMITLGANSVSGFTTGNSSMYTVIVVKK